LIDETLRAGESVGTFRWDDSIDLINLPSKVAITNIEFIDEYRQ
jgi:hypothetical protein